MLFGYPIEEVRKAVLAAFAAGLTLLGFFVTTDPNLPQAAAAVVIEVFAVIAVFSVGNGTLDWDKFTKAVLALVAAVIYLVGLFVSIEPDTEATIVQVVTQVLLVAGVFFARNEGNLYYEDEDPLAYYSEN